MTIYKLGESAQQFKSKLISRGGCVSSRSSCSKGRTIWPLPWA